MVRLMMKDGGGAILGGDYRGRGGVLNNWMASVRKAMVDSKVGKEELLGMDGVMQGQSKKFEIDVDEYMAVGAKTDDTDVIVGYRGSG